MSDGEGSSASKKVRRSLEEAPEFRQAIEDSIAIFNSSQMNDITQRSKFADNPQNNSDLFFDCVLTCQTRPAHSREGPRPQDTLDMISTLCTPETKVDATASRGNHDSDSDLFSDGENGTPNRNAKESTCSDQASLE